MGRAEKLAFDAAKEITIALMQEGNISVNANGGTNAADFFEAFYKKALPLAEEANN